MTRRRLLQAGALAGGALVVPWSFRGSTWAWAAIPGGSLDPTKVPKYVSPLVVPGPMPKVAVLRGGIDYYEIALRQFSQQVLPAGMPRTTVWGYGPHRDANAARYATPALSIEATVGTPVRVKWVNGLTGVRHLLPIDQTLHWANPPGGRSDRDSRPTFRRTPGRYDGPVPTVTHLHGAHSRQESDGYPQAWYLPAGSPRRFAATGRYYDIFRSTSPLGDRWRPGSAVYQYRNDQPATGLWFHDHTMGMTRANVYAGTAGNYFLRGGENDLPASLRPPELPLVIQDRCFNADGSLFYPGTREFFDEFDGPFVPRTNVPPIWNPEFFGNAMLVNGRTWPAAAVPARPHRLRLLNGCGSRFVVLKLVASPDGPRPKAAALPFVRIGGDGGLLRAPVAQTEILLGPAERADVIVDFGAVPAGTSLFLVNEGPDEPWGGPIGGRAGNREGEGDWVASDPATTGQVMRFDVVSSAGAAFAPVAEIAAAAAAAAPPVPRSQGAPRVRRVSLNELASKVHDGPAEARLGTVRADGSGRPLMFADDVTERPRAGVTEIWEIHNFTEDAHPIHLHQTQFEIVDRRAPGLPVTPAQPYERGPKDTAVVLPSPDAEKGPAITRLRATFDLRGRYVWHCHILEHEDNEMMRPLVVR